MLSWRIGKRRGSLFCEAAGSHEANELYQKATVHIFMSGITTILDDLLL